MPKPKSRTAATRLTLPELAKAYDALIERGIPKEKLNSTSNILRTCVLLTIANSSDPKGPASPEAINFFKQLWNQSKVTKNVQLGELFEE